LPSLRQEIPLALCQIDFRGSPWDPLPTLPGVDTMTDITARVAACGFVLATVPFRGHAGRLLLHARRVVDGDHLHVSVDSVAGTVTLWGTPDILSIDDFETRFAPDPDAPLLPWLDRIDLAGFRGRRWSGGPLAERYDLRHYWATRDDDSRWLIDANTETMTCYSDRPWSVWKLQNDGDLSPCSMPDTKPAPVEQTSTKPAPQPAAVRSKTGPDSGPIEHSGRHVPQNLF
jgi:hypothetical protein